MAEAEEQVLALIKKHTKPKSSPLAGNSVGQDAIFLRKYMPKIMDHLHYRIVDVSTIKELARRWYPEKIANVPKKKTCHRALDDIKESIAELEYYRKHFFVEH